MINNNPELTTKDKKIALISADFQLRRVAELARIFSVKVAPRGEISPQDLLKERAEIRGKNQYAEMLNYMKDTLHNPDLRKRILGEELTERGFVDEDFLAYWVGYIADVQDIDVMQRIISALSDPAWVTQTREIFNKIGLNFDEYQDLSKLKEDQIQTLKKALRENLQRGSKLREETWQAMKTKPY